MKLPELSRDAGPVIPIVLLEAGGVSCAIPASHAVETMRLLPLTRLDDMPPFMLGAALIRGVSVPVIDLAPVLGIQGAPVGRLVTLSAGGRAVALAVERVHGVVRHPREAFEARPALLGAGDERMVSAILTRDRAVHLVLDALRVIEHHGVEA